MSRKIFTDYDFQSVSRIRNLPSPVNTDEPVRLADLNSAVEGLAWKDSVRVSTQGNLNLASPGATIDGITMVSGDRFLVPLQTTANQNGIYVWNGAAVAATRALDASTFGELEQAVTTVEEGTNAGATYRQTQVNGTIDTDTVTWGLFGTSAGPASETSSGIAELATQTETDTGTDDLRIVTPLKLATWPGRKRKATATIGDNSATQFDLTHNFGSRDVQVQIYRNASPWDNIEVDVERPDANTARVRFTSAPATNAYNVVVIG